MKSVEVMQLKNFDKKGKFQINPTFFIILVWLIFVNGFSIALNYFFVILLHELGHYFMAKYRGYKLSKFSLSPYGVSLSYYGQTLEERDEIYIAFAGPFVNLISALLITALWWIFPITYFWTAGFVEISLVIALSNLLPAYPLDGGRIFVSMVSNLINRKNAIKITFFINFFLSFLCFLLFIVFCFINFNPTFLLFGVFLVLGILDLNFISKYEKISIYNKETKSFTKPRLYVLSNDVKIKDLLKKIQANRTTIFLFINQNEKVVMLSDKKILEISLKYDISEKIEGIIKNEKNLNKNYEILLKNIKNT